jgi:hypothetical protein
VVSGPDLPPVPAHYVHVDRVAALSIVTMTSTTCTCSLL